jgi:hypothetical protein
MIVLNAHAQAEDKIVNMKDDFYEELDSVFDKFHKYHIKIMLGHLDSKVDGENMFKPTLGNESLHEISNLIVKSSMFPHRNIHKLTWKSHGKTYNQIFHILIDVRKTAFKCI